MKIRTSVGEDLEQFRPTATDLDWQLVVSGRWEEDRYHGGYIAYFITNIAPGAWVLDGVERNDDLDGVTEEDVEEGRLNDDQIQAMWGQTLEEAQNAEYRYIAALCDDAPQDAAARDIAAVLYSEVCKNGGKEVTEAYDVGGLLE